jgi:rubrerythrin
MSEPKLDDLGAAIAFAIVREVAAAEGYARLAARAVTPGLRRLFVELEGEERKHRALLEGLTAGGEAEFASEPVPDLGLTDTLPAEGPGPDMTLQDALVFAAKKEAAAVALYAGLAGAVRSPRLRDLFEFLANQERAHKLRLEDEYERQFLPEN